MPTASTRSIRTILAVFTLAAVALLTLAPRSLVGPARGQFMRLMSDVAAPLVDWIPYGGAERVLNTLMFVPLGATIALLLSRRAWLIAILAGVLLSATVEYAQASIPGRVPDPNDILWNTVGGAIGVIAVTLVRFAAAGVSRLRSRAIDRRVRPSPPRLGPDAAAHEAPARSTGAKCAARTLVEA